MRGPVLLIMMVVAIGDIVERLMRNDYTINNLTLAIVGYTTLMMTTAVIMRNKT